MRHDPAPLVPYPLPAASFLVRGREPDPATLHARDRGPSLRHAEHERLEAGKAVAGRVGRTRELDALIGLDELADPAAGTGDPFLRAGGIAAVGDAGLDAAAVPVEVFPRGAGGARRRAAGPGRPCLGRRRSARGQKGEEDRGQEVLPHAGRRSKGRATGSRGLPAGPGGHRPTAARCGPERHATTGRIRPLPSRAPGVTRGSGYARVVMLTTRPVGPRPPRIIPWIAAQRSGPTASSTARMISPERIISVTAAMSR
jgi:hypothetical protein